ncbi:hypothetical protein DV735_g1741, partial [Chaetothyriales sp. CBS 134920]
MAALDLTLYLVTDSTPAILGDKSLVDVVEEALKGGVTIVQYREKHADTGDMIRVASELHSVTQRYGVPFLINDRVDVCLAVGAEGVHIGQDDMTLSQARSLLGSKAIIGVTASSIDEARAAIEGGADYLGIGTMFPTPTKTNTKSIIGTRGTQAILHACDTGTAKSVPCVAIGSINASNVQRVLHQSAVGDNKLNGVAIVSAIIASSDPQGAARELKNAISTAPEKFGVQAPPQVGRLASVPDLLAQVPAIIKAHSTSSVLCHNMTNTVVQNFAANVCLATGSSPIMSMNGAEAADLAGLGGSLVVNMGTATPDILNVYLAGLRAYNAVGSPVVFDPVGGGATTARKLAIKSLLAGGYFSLIKGNEGEISAVAGTSSVQQHGVDSGPSTATSNEKAALVKSVAQRERCIVLMTGATDYLSDGSRTLAVSNGSPLLGKITGSGCALGAVTASYLAVYKEDQLIAVLSGLLHYEIAAERAAKKASGPGSFIPAFLDELYLLGQEFKDGKYTSLQSDAREESVSLATGLFPETAASAESFTGSFNEPPVLLAFRLSSTQASHTDRLVRIESMLKIEDTSRAKNVWGPSSPFPSIIGAARPESGLNPAAEAFRNFDADPGISALSLDNADDSRRAAASRANSVRFDESANNHYGQSRQSIDLPTRTGSGLGSHPLSERSLSHRSDGRISNAGFVRTNSFGLESSRLLSSIHNSPKVPANPPPGFFVLGPCPSIIRCWLTETFSNSSLLYAAICTGSTLSSVSKSLVEKMGLTDQITEEGGLQKIKLPVYLTEARITHASSRSASPAPQVPTLIAKFVVVEGLFDEKSIQIVVGSDVLRSHSADVLFSQDKLSIFDQDRNQLSVPLVRPENDEVFKNLSTASREQSGSVDFGRPQNVSQPSIAEKRPGIIGRPSRLDTEQLSMTYLPPASDAVRATPTSRSSTEFGQARPADDSKSTTGSEKSYTTPASKPASGAWGSSLKAVSQLLSNPSVNMSQKRIGKFSARSANYLDRGENGQSRFVSHLARSLTVPFAQIFNIPIYITTQNAARLGDTVHELSTLLPSGLPSPTTHPSVAAKLSPTSPPVLQQDKTAFSMCTDAIVSELDAQATPTNTGPQVPVEVILVGIETHICVTQTALDLLQIGHKVYILVDGVSSCNAGERGVALERLRKEGAIVTTSESILFELLGDASHPAFKAVNALIKDTKETALRAEAESAPKIPVKQQILQAKEELARLAELLNEDPEEHAGSFKKLAELGGEKVPVPVRKLVLASQAAIYKDVIPGYRIRAYRDEDLGNKVSKDVRRTRQYEHALVIGYKNYVHLLASLAKHRKLETEQQSLRSVAISCVCTLLLAVPHFNFRTELLNVIIRELAGREATPDFVKCVQTLEKFFQQDDDGAPSLEAVTLLTKLMRAREFAIREESLNTFHHLRLLSELAPVSSQPDKAAGVSKLHGKKAKKEKFEHRSKKERKLERERKAVEKDMREADASVNYEEREKMQSETLKLVFATYFRILKERVSSLMGAVLEGLSKYAHLINQDYFGDILEALKDIIQKAKDEENDNEGSHDQEFRNAMRETLLSTQTAFTLLSNQDAAKSASALHLDLSFFSSHTFMTLYPLSMDSEVELGPKSARLPDPHAHQDRNKVNVSTPILLLLRVLNSVLLTPSQPPPTIKVAGFYKRLLTMALQLPEKSSIALLNLLYKIAEKHGRKIEALWYSDERKGDGVFQGESETVEGSNVFSVGSGIWEEELLRKHYCPQSRVYYMPLRIANLATSVARDNLVSMGTCVGKFSKTGKFRLHITALDMLATHARYKVWVKANGEMPFLYGGNVVKAHVGRWSDVDVPEHSGIVVLSMDDTPLGFGVTARSSAEATRKSAEPTMVVVFRQADVGEYLRDEDTLFAS